MSKRKNYMPSLQPVIPTEEPVDLTLPDVDESPERGATSDPLNKAIEVPIGHVDESRYQAQHIQVGGLSREERHALRALRSGLEQAGEMLSNGKPVQSYADSIRWLLQRIAG